MMLQGHFIDTLLATSYRDLNAVPFLIWSYFRGITAPLFFTISGLIFTYLLIRAKEKGQANKRMKKGIIRGFFLIGVGYLIRIPILSWLYGDFNTRFLIIDVLNRNGYFEQAIDILYSYANIKWINSNVKYNFII